MLFSTPRTILPVLALGIYSARAQSTACTTQCQPMLASINAAQNGPPGALCTQDVLNEYQACLGCEVAAAIITQTGAQAIVNALVDTCKVSGHPIDGFTVTAATPTDAGGAATPTSGAATAPSDTSTPVSAGGDISASGAAAPTAGSGSGSDAPIAGSSGAAAPTAGSGSGGSGTPSATGASAGSPAGSTPAAGGSGAGGAPASATSGALRSTASLMNGAAALGLCILAVVYVS
ncbi:hypothetical protein C8R44DRAFT_878701 [Mycena epipterygia]|nr:hypothetical protein C8R44DRAFT_878701 [Mycena epipterygia]